MEENGRRHYKNECPYSGSREIVLMEHMSGIPVPAKCLDCKNNVEGQCKILTNPYKRLDYPPCGIQGETHLVEYPGAVFPIPAKCVACQYLFQLPKVRRIMFCKKDLPGGVTMGRGLDYGDTDPSKKATGPMENRDRARHKPGKGGSDDVR